jgi:hypothetical protein
MRLTWVLTVSSVMTSRTKISGLGEVLLGGQQPGEAVAYDLVSGLWTRPHGFTLTLHLSKGILVVGSSLEDSGGIHGWPRIIGGRCVSVFGRAVRSLSEEKRPRQTGSACRILRRILAR